MWKGREGLGRESRVRGSEEFGKMRQHTERLAVEAEGHRGLGPWARVGPVGTGAADSV